MKRGQKRIVSQDGFTIVELIAGMVLFAAMVAGLTISYVSLRHSYMVARQLNEMYTVLSACPEVDRALEYTSLSGSTNCYPNNSFQVENTTASRSITYTPTLTVTDTGSLASSDPLKAVPDSKVVKIVLPFPSPSSAPALQLRMLITRNGIGQQ
jgi:type II secretory pathway pseudopilin PulG